MINFLSKVPAGKLKGVAILRLDFNTENHWRMEATVPTVRFLLKRSSKIVILSHRGRPSGIKLRNGLPLGFDKKLSLRKDARGLERLLGRKVTFVPHFRFGEIKKTIVKNRRESVLLLENIRFLEGEEKNDSRLARALAGLGDFYVNDSFAVDHRKNASLVAITDFLPSYAGLELEKEIVFLSRAMRNPSKPLVVILGGAKARDKLGVINFFRNKADRFLIGGAAANTLLSLKGVDVGRSLAETDPENVKKLRKILPYKNILLPTDWIKENGRILDIGKRTVSDFSSDAKKARTIIWSGPLGAIEEKKFSRGTLAVARAIASNKKVFSVAGGGETVMFLKKNRLDKKFGFISTGGGAMLEFLAGEKLPAIEALKPAERTHRK